MPANEITSRLVPAKAFHAHPSFLWHDMHTCLLKFYLDSGILLIFFSKQSFKISQRICIQVYFYINTQLPIPSNSFLFLISFRFVTCDLAANYAVSALLTPSMYSIPCDLISFPEQVITHTLNDYQHIPSWETYFHISILTTCICCIRTKICLVGY